MKKLYEKNELTFILKNKLGKRYGLCKSAAPAGRFLYYVPLVILATDISSTCLTAAGWSC